MRSARVRFHATFLIVVATLMFTGAQVLQAQDSTATIHYKGITLTPIGFVAAEGVWRQRNITADIGSSYGAIPFSGTTNGQLTESRVTGRQSRIGMLVAGANGTTKYQGYWESDFLGVGTTSNSNESNSYVLRLRQFWGSAAFSNGWTLAAGQMWSLATPGKSGALPRSEHVPLTIEAQYAVGFDWARQFGLRLINKTDALTFALALEGSQTTFSARNAPATFVIGQAGGSLLNSTTNYSTDYSPDLVAKLALDPAGMGHWEIKGVVREMRDRIVDPTNVNGGSRNITNTAYGVGFGVFFPILASTTPGDIQVSVTAARPTTTQRSLVDLGLSFMYGQGIGRYGTSQLPDATVDVDGSLKPIKASQALLSIEAHPTSDLDVYVYGGAEYADRTAFVNSAGKGVGYGSVLNNNSGCQTEAAPTNQTTPNSGTCQADTRAFWQGNLGFWYRFYRGAAGTLQWGMQYSYTSKNVWVDSAGNQPQAIDNMLFTSFRYVLP